MSTCGFRLQPGGLTEENGVISLNEHADSMDKLTTVKLIARVFSDLTPQLLSLVINNNCLQYRCCPLANNVENVDCGQLWA